MKKRAKDLKKRRRRTRETTALVAELRKVLGMGDATPALQVLSAGASTRLITAIYHPHPYPSHRRTRGQRTPSRWNAAEDPVGVPGVA